MFLSLPCGRIAKKKEFAHFDSSYGLRKTSYLTNLQNSSVFNSILIVRSLSHIGRTEIYRKCMLRETLGVIFGHK